MKKLPLLILTVILAASCATSKRIVYLQDATPGQPAAVSQPRIITLQPQDQVSIMVSSKDPELAAILNLPRIQQSVGTSGGGSGSGASSQGILGYTVDSKGEIDFPVLGKVHIEGLTREQIAVMLKDRIISENLLKDPVVTVDFMNLQFSALGEVSQPGRFDISRDQINIFEALSMAGDLTITGQRDRVFVVRTDKERTTYQLDLRSESVYDSPAFYVQQNDVIYVEPNKMRANQSTINANNVRNVSFWMSLASFLMAVTAIAK